MASMKQGQQSIHIKKEPVYGNILSCGLVFEKSLVLKDYRVVNKASTSLH